MWNAKRPPKHCWIYDDTAMIGPLAESETEDGTKFNIFNELQKTNRGLIVSKRGAFIIVKREVWDAISAWASGGQIAGLELHDYLNRMFGSAKL